MTFIPIPEQASELLQQLTRIADAVEAIARSTPPAAPNFSRPIEEYPHFDWSTIQARVIKSDPEGATHVEWGGETWTRRSPANKFEPAIWYSRANGKDDDGNVLYLRLITFKEFKDSDPLAPGVQREITRLANQAAPAQPAGSAPAQRQASAPGPASGAGQPAGGPGRTPGQVKAELLRTVEALAPGKVLTEGQKGILAPALEACFPHEEDQVGARKVVIKFLTGHDSLRDIPALSLYALYTWLKPYKDKDRGQWHAGKQAEDEAWAILVECRGQTS